MRVYVYCTMYLHTCIYRILICVRLRFFFLAKFIKQRFRKRLGYEQCAQCRHSYMCIIISKYIYCGCMHHKIWHQSNTCKLKWYSCRHWTQAIFGMKNSTLEWILLDFSMFSVPSSNQKMNSTLMVSPLDKMKNRICLSIFYLILQSDKL